MTIVYKSCIMNIYRYIDICFHRVKGEKMTCFVYLLFLYSKIRRVKMEKRLFAHRGMSALAPENTLSAIKKCREYGVEWFECDVDILKDGTIVISHDDTLDRCTNRAGSLYDITKEELEKIDAGSWFSDEFKGEKMPTLDELVEVINKEKLNVNIELKSCAAGKVLTQKLIDGLVEAIKKIDKDLKVIVSSFNYLALYLFKQKSPETPVACLFEDHTLYSDCYSILEFCEAEYIHPQNEGLTEKRVKEMKSKGYKINVWTVNSLARANELFNWGVDGIFTDIANQFPEKYKK